MRCARGHGDIVEHTIAFAAIGKGMMRAAGQAHGQAIRERRARSTNCGDHGSLKFRI